MSDNIRQLSRPKNPIAGGIENVSREVGGPHPDGLLVNGDIIPLIVWMQHPTIECSGNMHGNCEK